MVAVLITIVICATGLGVHLAALSAAKAAIERLTKERDEARKEANDLRIAIFPQLGRIGNPNLAGTKPAVPAAPAEPPKPLTRAERIKLIWNSKKPFRVKIKEM